MQCEMCGETIRGRPMLIRVEGAELQVCSRCQKYGTAVQQPRRTDTGGPAPAAGRRPVSPSPAISPTVRRKRDMFDFIEGEIVDDYADRIRHTREGMGLTQKDLAMQIKEKEHLIKKIENSDLIPEDGVRRKLEKALSIRLIDVPESGAEKKVPSTMAPTLGDVTIIRKTKK